MTLCSLANAEVLVQNGAMAGRIRSHYYLATLALAGTFALAACSGVALGPQTHTSDAGSGSLSVSPAALNFGDVAIGNSASLHGTLSAINADVVVSSAAWNGSGYSVSGITFPVTIPAGESANYTVTFAPPGAGVSSGEISFISNASNSALNQTFSGDGTQTSRQYSVALSWNPSTSTVIGYNVYRGIKSGGPYSRLNSAPLLRTVYTDGNVQSGDTYYYVSTAINANNIESVYSNQVTAVVP